MSSVFRLLLLFVGVPLVELVLLVRIGEAIGFWPTVALVMATGVLGAALARAQGVATWARFRRTLAGGGMPGRELVEGALILVAGAVLLTPGILTDAAGFLLLVPPFRRRLAAAIERRVGRRIDRVAARRRAPDDDRGETIDAEFEVRESDER